MIKKVVISHKNGLQTAECAVFAQAASKFKSNVYLICADKRINAKSIMGLISLNVKPKQTVYLSVEGTDEQQAAFTTLIKLL